MFTENDPIIDDCETEDPHEWESSHCAYCGEPNDDTALFRRGGFYHESCLEHIAKMGGIDEY